MYLSPHEQERLYPELSRVLGWNTVTRRNVGLLHAYRLGYEVIATVDDDNEPLPHWGLDVRVGRTVPVHTYRTELPVFDPLYALGRKDLWHRGFPWQWLGRRNAEYVGLRDRTVLVQADLWHGDPDIDAICRMSNPPQMNPPPTEPFTALALLPFNSQNTFLHRSVVPDYMMLSDVGRVQDIWGGYLLQHVHPGCVIYGSPTVRQRRNEHDLVNDLAEEMLQYRDTQRLLENLAQWEDILPPKTIQDYHTYRRHFTNVSLGA